MKIFLLLYFSFSMFLVAWSRVDGPHDLEPKNSMSHVFLINLLIFLVGPPLMLYVIFENLKKKINK